MVSTRKLAFTGDEAARQAPEICRKLSSPLCRSITARLYRLNSASFIQPTLPLHEEIVSTKICRWPEALPLAESVSFQKLLVKRRAARHDAHCSVASEGRCQPHEKMHLRRG
jgi:hypothetical protein